MKNLAMTAEEAKEYSGQLATTSPDDAPKYPWGLTLDLSDDVLKKLGMTELPKVGAIVEIRALAKVKRISSNEEQDGDTNTCMGLQITDMEIAGAPKTESDVAKRMYPEME